MQARVAVTEVMRVVGRQHTRMRGLVCEVAQTGGAERVAAAEWLSHYLVLHAAAERVGLRREFSAPRPSTVPHHGALVGSVVGLALGLTQVHSLDEAAICHRAAELEAAVVRHARAQERAILPRLLSRWPLADLQHAIAALEAADLVFDHGPAQPLATLTTPDAIWRTAVTAIEQVVTAVSDESAQAAAPRAAMTTAATSATTATTAVTPAVRST